MFLHYLLFGQLPPASILLHVTVTSRTTKVSPAMYVRDISCPYPLHSRPALAAPSPVPPSLPNYAWVECSFFTGAFEPSVPWPWRPRCSCPSLHSPLRTRTWVLRITLLHLSSPPLCLDMIHSLVYWSYKHDVARLKMFPWLELLVLWAPGSCFTTWNSGLSWLLFTSVVKCSVYG